MTSNSKAEGRFSKADFIYIREDDEYQCPAGERLRYRHTAQEKDQNILMYWADGCGSCAMKASCTTGKERRVRRWEHEEILEQLHARREEATQADDGAATHRRTRVRDIEALDGVNPLPDSRTCQRKHRDEPAGARLQPQAGAQHLGYA